MIDYWLDICRDITGILGQRYCQPVMGHSLFIKNGRDDDRINNYAFV